MKHADLTQPRGALTHLSFGAYDFCLAQRATDVSGKEASSDFKCWNHLP